MASRGLLTMIRTAFGDLAATFFTTSFMIFILVAIRSSRLIPGFLGMPAVMITMSESADVIISIRTHEFRIMFFDRRCLHQVKRLSLGYPFDDIDQHHIAQLLFRKPLGRGGAHIPRTDYRYFFVHNRPLSNLKIVLFNRSYRLNAYKTYMFSYSSDTSGSLDKFPVHPRNIGDGNLLGTFGLAFRFIRAVTETPWHPWFQPSVVPAGPPPVAPGAAAQDGISWRR